LVCLLPQHFRSRGYLQRACELRPQDPTIALAYSEALERNHELPQAREVLETSLKSHPDLFSPPSL
jgi:hypothetical protein